MLSLKKRPNVFIVGAPKCGTTALNHYLAAHPDIYMARKEMHFFGTDLHFGPQFFRRDQAAYLTEFNTWNGQSCGGEASVWYLFSQQAAAEIKAFNPEARIIVMLREPVAMLHSLYHQFRCDGNEHLPTFAEALAAENERRMGRRISRQAVFVQGLLYRAAAAYTEQLRRYFDQFGRERVLVVLYEDFAADVASTYRKILEFLEVDLTAPNPHFQVINGNNNITKVRSLAFRAVLNDPLVRGTAVALRVWLPRPVFQVVQRWGLRLNDLNVKPRTQRRASLDPDLRCSLRREFVPEVERLSNLLGRDLTHWSRPELPA